MSNGPINYGPGYVPGYQGDPNDPNEAADNVNQNAIGQSGTGDLGEYTNLGGVPGGANSIANQDSAYANQAQGRTGANPFASGAAASAAYNGQESQSQQQQALRMMQLQASGGGPNYAAQTMNAGLAQSVANQKALAASSGAGSGGAAAQRGAAVQGAQLGIQNTNNVNQVTAANQVAAQQAYSTAANQYLTANQNQQQMEQQGAEGYGQLQYQQGAANDAMSQNYQQLGQSAEAAQLGADSSIYNGANAIGTAETIQNQNQATQFGVQAIGAGVSMGAGAAGSDVRLKTNLSFQGGDPGNSAGPSSMGGMMADARTKQAPMMQQGGMAAMIGKGGLSEGTKAVAQDSAPLAFSSDARGKSVRPGGNTLADKFMEHLHPYSYRYKDPKNEPRSTPTGGHYLGVLAQDVERSPAVGRQVVRDTPEGKVLEGGALSSALAAGVGRLHERLKALEGERADKGKKKRAA
jgi:hypothetical protein